MTLEPNRARFPGFAPRRGGYESFYVKAAAPDRSRAVWIRYTIHQRAHEAPRGSMWFTWFDPGAEGPQASKVTVPSAPMVTADDELQIGDGVLGPGFLRGAAPSEGLDVSWQLTYEGAAEPLWHLPREWMYTAPLPRTKLLSPVPRARVSGSVRLGDQNVELDAWPAMVGHNWGTQHAERWIWLHGALFDGHGSNTWLDVALGRIKVGPVHDTVDRERRHLPRRSPAPDRRHRQGARDQGRRDAGGLRVHPARGRPHPQGSGLGAAPGSRGLGVRRPGRLRARHRELLRRGPGAGRGSRRVGAAGLTAPGSATYELGMREKDHGITIQPFPDH